MMKTLIYIWLLTWVSVALGIDRDYAFRWAIREVESKHEPNPEPQYRNGEKYIGPHMVCQRRWNDTLRIYYDLGGNWSMCERDDYSWMVASLYIKAFATQDRIGHDPTWEDKARIWNGGPDGWKDDRTIEYWHRVERAMGEAK